jgi:hypothetical protein
LFKLYFKRERGGIFFPEITSMKCLALPAWQGRSVDRDRLQDRQTETGNFPSPSVTLNVIALWQHNCVWWQIPLFCWFLVFLSAKSYYDQVILKAHFLPLPPFLLACINHVMWGFMW